MIKFWTKKIKILLHFTNVQYTLFWNYIFDLFAFYYTRLLGCIFFFSCKHFLFVYIVKQKTTIKFVDFQNLMQIKFCWRQIFEILIIYKPSLGTWKVPHDRFSRFYVYWIQTNKQTNKQTDKQTDRQAKFIYRFSY